MLITHINNPNTNSVYSLSYKNIRLTAHAIKRGKTRLNLNQKQLQRLAASAKKNGLNITKIDKNFDYAYYNIPENQFKGILNFLETTFYFNKAGLASKKFYLYKGIIWIFCGHHAQKLKTLFELKNEYFKEDYSFNKKCNQIRSILGSSTGRYNDSEDIEDLFDCFTSNGEDD